MKYKLINQTTKEETLCDKVTIDGFDYYVSDEKEQVLLGRLYYEYDNHIPIYSFTEETLPKQYYLPQVIATNNPNIDVPKVVDEVEELAHEYFAQERFNWEQENPNGLKFPQPLVEQYNKTFTPLYKAGYNKSQETHSFSEEDMIEFVDFVEKSMCDDEGYTQFKTNKELLQLWKEQKIKTIYYE